MNKEKVKTIIIVILVFIVLALGYDNLRRYMIIEGYKAGLRDAFKKQNTEQMEKK